MTRILGISAFYHDSAVALITDGRITAAMQEERFSRIKHDNEFPARAIQACLDQDGCKISDIDYVVFYEKPFSKFERLLETYLQHSPRGLASYLKSIPVWIKDKLWIKDFLFKQLDGYEGPVLFSEHHESHAASAFFPSPFVSAAILTSDGVGEWTTSTLGRGENNNFTLELEQEFPDSLGLLYTAFTYYLGFNVNSGEYKVMGLAPYGDPLYAEIIEKEIIDIHSDGSFILNQKYFNYQVGLEMISRHFSELFGQPPRNRMEHLQTFHKNIAASVQKVTEKVMLLTARFLHEKTGENRLCMAGGIALNCVANGRILRETPFREIWIQPAAGDAGGALGAALAVWYQYLGNKRSVNISEDSQQGSLLGTCYQPDEIRIFLQDQGAVFHELDEDSIYAKTAERLVEGSVTGWFRGRMEYGPRALGNRSIIADPRRDGMLDEVNLKIKYRESFRPFAPAVLEEDADKYFRIGSTSPYMLLVGEVLPSRRNEIPAITHVDGSARVQTVSESGNRDFYRLISAFKKIAGCSVVLNTSFNVRGEPIVESPAQAYRCFMRTGMDCLVIENFFLKKSEQPDGIQEPGDQDAEDGTESGI
ncbi:MAG: carbamoyltransferase [Acidobacteriota bacterium]